MRRVSPKKLLDLGRPRELEVAALANARNKFPIAANLPAELFVGHVCAREEAVNLGEE